MREPARIILRKTAVIEKNTAGFQSVQVLANDLENLALANQTNDNQWFTVGLILEDITKELLNNRNAHKVNDLEKELRDRMVALRGQINICPYFFASSRISMSF
ncbi:MAG: hypothetical protein WCX24_02160 [Candidatus Paceibacterota bacterium]|jgi:hypothetical protein|nr:hypothetical protein [Candidatus Paceibacterota bacterium]MDD5555053.1 hypothetical protein [Candidatus Paceibacterota bacterium]